MESRRFAWRNTAERFIREKRRIDLGVAGGNSRRDPMFSTITRYPPIGEDPKSSYCGKFTQQPLQRELPRAEEQQAARSPKTTPCSLLRRELP